MKGIRIWPLAIWCFWVILTSYLYARNRIYSPEAAPGYETMWSFQVTMFALFRFPILIIALCGILFLETKWLRNHSRKNQ